MSKETPVKTIAQFVRAGVSFMVCAIDQSGLGRCAESITRKSAGPFVASSLSPNCSRSAVVSTGNSGSVRVRSVVH